MPQSSDSKQDHGMHDGGPLHHHLSPQGTQNNFWWEHLGSVSVGRPSKSVDDGRPDDVL
jgi:hypothetical protein